MVGSLTLKPVYSEISLYVDFIVKSSITWIKFHDDLE